jgi:chromosome partitioning protein
MKTVAIISQKGGVGKTTAAIEIGFAAHQARFVTAIIDLDPQGTAAKWGDRREADGPSVIASQASRLSVILETVRQNGADIAIIDTPPSAEAIAMQSAKVADFILIPTRPGGFDLEAIQTTLEMVELLKLPAAVLVNSVPTNRLHLGVSTLAGLWERGIASAPVVWMERAAFADLGADGIPAPERDPESKASQEVAGLFSWLCEQVGLASSPLEGGREQFNKMSQAVLKVQLAALALAHQAGDGPVAELGLGFRRDDRDVRQASARSNLRLQQGLMALGRGASTVLAPRGFDQPPPPRTRGWS